MGSPVYRDRCSGGRRRRRANSYLKGPSLRSPPRSAQAAPVAPVVAPVRAPIVTVLHNSCRADDRGRSRDRPAAEHSRPASTSWA